MPDTRKRERTTRALVLGVVLIGVWLLWSGHYTPLLVSLGVVSCLLVVTIATRMDVADREGAPTELALRALRYLPWLAFEILKANLDVARRILSRTPDIQPQLLRVRCSQRSDIAQVVYANSITLTPGTVSVDTIGNEILVHALTDASARDVASGRMDARVADMEGRV